MQETDARSAVPPALVRPTDEAVNRVFEPEMEDISHCERGPCEWPTLTPFAESLLLAVRNPAIVSGNMGHECHGLMGHVPSMIMACVN